MRGIPLEKIPAHVVLVTLGDEPHADVRRIVSLSVELPDVHAERILAVVAARWIPHPHDREQIRLRVERGEIEVLPLDETGGHRRNAIANEIAAMRHLPSGTGKGTSGHLTDRRPVRQRIEDRGVTWWRGRRRCGGRWWRWRWRWRRCPAGYPDASRRVRRARRPGQGDRGRRLFEATADDERCHRKNRRRAAPSNACCFYRKWSRLGSAFLVSCAPGTVNGLRRTRGSVRIHVLTVDVMRKN